MADRDLHNLASSMLVKTILKNLGDGLLVFAYSLDMEGLHLRNVAHM